MIERLPKMIPAPARTVAKRQGNPAAFGRLLASNAFESVADNATRTLLPVIAVSSLGAGTAEVGLLNALGLGAFLVLGLPIGALVDRFPKLTAMRAADLARAALTLAIPLLFLLGSLDMRHMLVAAALLGIADVFFTSASGALVPSLVGSADVGVAYARLQRASALASIGTPAVATTALKILAAPLALVLGSVGYLCSALLLPRAAAQTFPPGPGPRPRFRHSIAQGLSMAVRQPVMRALLLSNMLLNAAAMLGNSVLAVFVISSLGFSAATFTVVGSVSASGGLVASLLAPFLLGRMGIGRLKIAASLGCVPAVAVLALAEILPGPALAWVAAQSFVWSFMLVLATVAGAGVIPQLCGESRLGTAMAGNRFLTLGIMPVASIAGGIAASTLGIQPVLWAWALLAGSSALPVMFSPLRSWHQSPGPNA